MPTIYIRKFKCSVCGEFHEIEGRRRDLDEAQEERERECGLQKHLELHKSNSQE